MRKINQYSKFPLSHILFFSFANAFQYIPVCEEEEEVIELTKLMDRVPIPVKEFVDEPSTNINVLLQVYISQLKLEEYALMADRVFVTQSAGRILSVVFEICFCCGWAQSCRRYLDSC